MKKTETSGQGSKLARLACCAALFSLALCAAPARGQEHAAFPMLRPLMKLSRGGDAGADPSGAARSGGLAMELWHEPGQGLRVKKQTACPRLDRYGQGAKKQFVLDLGEIMPGDRAVSCTAEDGGFDWIKYSLNPKAGIKNSVFISRMSPAMLFETESETVLLFANAPRDGFFLASEDWTAGFPSPMGEPDAVIGAVGEWLLFWQGGHSRAKSTRFPYAQHSARDNDYMYDADVPMLVVFAEPPLDARHEESGIEVEFFVSPDSGKNAFLLMPLFGEYNPPAEETGSWAKGLPEDVRERCEFWAEKLARYPLTIAEVYRHDRETDTLQVECSTLFKPVRGDGGAPWAPVSPMLALAEAYGFPISFSGDLLDCAYPSMCGPVKMIPGSEKYSYAIKGMGKYVLAERRHAIPENEKTGKLRAMLDAELAKVLEAGHLAPWFPLVDKQLLGPGNRLAFQNPGEVLCFFDECLAATGQNNKQDELLREYCDRENREFPIEEAPLLDYRIGARRERHPYHETYGRYYEDGFAGNTYVVNNLIPIEGLYYIARYYRMTGRIDELKQRMPAFEKIAAAYDAVLDYASLGTYRLHYYGSRLSFDLYSNKGGVIDANKHFAGRLGMARLAAMAGDEQAYEMAMGKFAQAAARRFGLAKTKNFLVDSGIFELPENPGWMMDRAMVFNGRGGHLWVKNWVTAADDIRQVFSSDEFGFYFYDSDEHCWGAALHPFMYLTPETGRFMKDFLGGEAARFCEVVVDNMPDWYVKDCESLIGTENAYLPPHSIYGVFMAYAWILDAEPDALQKMIDMSWTARGDYYYMHKLAETIKAYGRTEWAPMGSLEISGLQ